MKTKKRISPKNGQKRPSGSKTPPIVHRKPPIVSAKPPIVHKSKKRKPRGRPRALAFDWPIAESTSQASEIVGWPESVFRQLKRAGAPGFKHGRVYFAELIPWIGKRGLDDSEIDWSRELKKEQALAARRKRNEDEKRLVDRDVIAAQSQRAVAMMLTALERIFGRELPPVLKGRDEKAIEIRCLAEIDRLKEELSTAFAQLAEKPENQIESTP